MKNSIILASFVILSTFFMGCAADAGDPSKGSAVVECTMYIPYGIQPTAPIPFQVIDGLLSDGGTLPQGWIYQQSGTVSDCQCGVTAPNGDTYTGICN